MLLASRELSTHCDLEAVQLKSKAKGEHMWKKKQKAKSESPRLLGFVSKEVIAKTRKIGRAHV